MQIETISQDGYELVKHATDSSSGLDAIIAIHSTKLGPAVGGLRIKQYASLDDMLFDAKRLAESMTYKCSLAGIDFGGGKCVMNVNPAAKSDKLFDAMAEFISSFNGMIHTGKDLNTSLRDVAYLKSKCQYIVEGIRQANGDPSPTTALGVYNGIKAAINVLDPKASLKDMSVLIQGIGDVGYPLASMLYPSYKQLLIADIEKDKLDKFIESGHEYAVAVDHESFWHKANFDIFVPCAVGNVINHKTATLLKERGCKIIAGSANNQLSKEDVGMYLSLLDILYMPDFAINAGGLLDVTARLRKKSMQELEEEISKEITSRLAKIANTAKEQNLPTNVVAMDIAKARLS